MPKQPTESERLSLRIPYDHKSMVIQAASLDNSSLTDFVLKAALAAAKQTIEEHQKLELSNRDARMLLDLLDNPPAPNNKLLKAAFNLPKQED